MDSLNEIIFWWHWVALGILLIIIELFVGTFFIMALGISAIIIGIVTFFIDFSFSVKILSYIVLSLVTISILLKYFKKEGCSTVGQSDDKFDTLGVVLEDIEPNKRGKVEFDKPFLGNKVWSATSSQMLRVGDRVKIKEVKGQLITVERS